MLLNDIRNKQDECYHPLNYAGSTLRGRYFKYDQDLTEANFSGANLQGVNFKRLNLTRANFSGADIRGANFTRANLREANFMGARAGLQKNSMIGLVSLGIVLSILSGLLTAIMIALSAYSFIPNNIQKIPPNFGIFLFVVVAILSYIILSQGFTAKALGIFLFAVSGLLVFTTVKNLGGVLAAFGLAVFFAGAFILAFTSVLAFALIQAVVKSVATAFVFIILLIVAVFFAISIVVGTAKTATANVGISLAFTFFGTAIIIFLSYYIALQASEGEEKYALIRKTAVAFAAIGGTCFYQADLTKSTFLRAKLRNTDFRKAVMVQTCWQESQELALARVGETILDVPEVLELLVTGQGVYQNYAGKNLKGANLAGADLSNADLTEADISNATLIGANLENINLTRIQALGTDFEQAILTGAFLESWHIDSTTKLEGVICKHVYLLKNQCERRPSSGDFAAGEFTKLFQEVLNTIDLIFQDGIDRKAFEVTFETLKVQNANAELTIQSIENKGDGVVVVRVNAPPEVNKEKYHSEFTQNYAALKAKHKAELKAKDAQIEILYKHNADLMKIITTKGEQPISIYNVVESKAMQNSPDQSRKIEIGDVGGDFNASGSVLNLGDISGIVTNTLHQLRSSSQPNANELSDRLKNLQAAIETESELNDDDKAEALEQVNVLAQAGQNLQDNTLKKTANTALKILKGTIAALTPTAAIAKACADLLPALTKLLGL